MLRMNIFLSIITCLIFVSAQDVFCDTLGRSVSEVFYDASIFYDGALMESNQYGPHRLFVKNIHNDSLLFILECDGDDFPFQVHIMRDSIEALIFHYFLDNSFKYIVHPIKRYIFKKNGNNVEMRIESMDYVPNLALEVKDSLEMLYNRIVRDRKNFTVPGDFGYESVLMIYMGYLSGLPCCREFFLKMENMIYLDGAVAETYKEIWYRPFK